MRAFAEELKTTRSREDFEMLTRRATAAGRKKLHWAEICGTLRRDAEQAARNALGDCFVVASQAMLTAEQFEAVMESAKAALDDPRLLQLAARPRDPQKASGKKPLTEEQREKERLRSQAKDTRKMLLAPNSHRAKRMAEKRAKYGGGGPQKATKGPETRLVWKEF